jgi:peptidoglycan/xylan/chitin deacetylase (PgdA/CDA1 family)
MPIRFHLTICAIAFGALLGSGSLLAQGYAPTQEESHGQRCWTPEALAMKPDEKISRRVPYDSSAEPQGAALSRSPVPENLRGSIRGVKVSGKEKLIALTFDLCETANEISGYDGQIVDTLRAKGVKATFFAGGKWLIDHHDRAQQLLSDPLFEVGGHSWTHDNYRLLSPEEVKADLTLDIKADAGARQSLTTKECLQPLSPASQALQQMSIFRFPFGTCNAENIKAVNDAGLMAIQWDVVSADPVRAQTAELIKRGVEGSAKPGSIVVMHGNGRGWHTAEALPGLIDDLRKRGFKFVTVSELLAKGQPVIADSCYELKPGDNTRYDKLFPVVHRIKTTSARSDSQRFQTRAEPAAGTPHT